MDNPPEIVCPDDIVVDATDASGAIVDYPDPVASDVEDATVTVVCEPESGTLFAVGDTIVNCTATDSAGNTATCSFVVTVNLPTVDNPPEIVCPDDIVVDATDASGAIVDYPDPVASDVEDATVTVVCEPESGTLFAVGDTIVNCTATDSAEIPPPAVSW